MENKQSGWLILTEKHPRSRKLLVIWSTFSPTRKEAIENFVSGSGSSWKYWKRNYGYKAVKAESLIMISNEYSHG